MSEAQVQLGAKVFNDQELKVIEITLYQMADMINRLLKDRVPYTKAVVGGNNVPAIQ